MFPGLLLPFCNGQSPPGPDGDPVGYFGRCNSKVGKVCDPEEGTFCFHPLDANNKPDKNGLCICKPTFGRGVIWTPEAIEIYKTNPPLRPTDHSDPLWVEAQKHLKERCIPYTYAGTLCGPRIRAPFPQPEHRLYPHPKAFRQTFVEFPNINVTWFLNTGCQEYLTGLECDIKADIPKCRCRFDIYGAPGYDRDKQMPLQDEIGQCIAVNQRTIGENCTAGIDGFCTPTPDLYCNPRIRKCICLNPKTEWFQTGSEKKQGRCVETISYNGDCDPDVPNANGWCSKLKNLTCSKKTRRCVCDTDTRSWLPSEAKCLLGDKQPCPKDQHKECATQYCNNNGYCERQVGNGQPCPSGKNEQCSSGFCDPKKKICVYSYITETTKSSGSRLEPREFACLNIIGVLLTSTVSGIFGL